jgi:hypothetical protein
MRPIRSKRTEAYYFDTAPECRAKAASLRTMSAFNVSAALKERLLKMALEWDVQAEAYDALG